MINMDWLTPAKALPLGGRRKIKHCGTTPSLSITSTMQGWRAYCHRCKESAHEFRTAILSHSEIEQWKSRLKTISPSLPSDASKLFEEQDPVSLLWMTWLLRGGISASLRHVYSPSWSSSVKRACIPVCTGDPTSKNTILEGVLYRRLLPEDRGPKYLLSAKNPETSVFLSQQSRAQLINCEQRLVDIVVVEDVLSAMRVGEFLPTGSLLGTSLGQGKLLRILDHSNVSAPRVGIWQDPDKAGQISAANVTRSLKLMGVQYEVLTSARDPKNLSDTDIVRRLTGDRHTLVADYEVPERLRDAKSAYSDGQSE